MPKNTPTYLVKNRRSPLAESVAELAPDLVGRIRTSRIRSLNTIHHRPGLAAGINSHKQIHLGHGGVFYSDTRSVHIT